MTTNFLECGWAEWVICSESIVGLISLLLYLWKIHEPILIYLNLFLSRTESLWSTWKCFHWRQQPFCQCLSPRFSNLFGLITYSWNSISIILSLLVILHMWIVTCNKQLNYSYAQAECVHKNMQDQHSEAELCKTVIQHHFSSGPFNPLSMRKNIFNYWKYLAMHN